VQVLVRLVAAAQQVLAQMVVMQVLAVRVLLRTAHGVLLLVLQPRWLEVAMAVLLAMVQTERQVQQTQVMVVMVEMALRLTSAVLAVLVLSLFATPTHKELHVTFCKSS